MKTSPGETSSERFAHLFKPEVQRSGRDLIKKKSVYLQVGSDTQIDASVRATTPAKVGFRSTSIDAESFDVDCSCTSSKRGQFCKHIWAVLETALNQKPDFFEAKTTLEKGDFVEGRAAASVGQRTASAETTASAEAFKAKQADYRKSVYAAQKDRAKEFTRKRQATERHESIRSSSFSKSLPDEIKTALEYFDKNGFPMTIPVDEPMIQNAKRVLSRVFHPDKGGTHDEIVELLRHSEALVKFRL